MRTIPILVSLAVACDGGQTGEEGARCDPVASEDLGADEVSALGFSGADVLAVSEGAHAATLAWAIGGTTEVAAEVTPDGSVRYVQYEYVDTSGQEPAAALDCVDQLELGATVTWSTADGAFDESYTGVLEAPAVDDVTFTHAIDLDALGGTYAVTTEIDLSGFDDVRAWVDLGFYSASWRGVVDGQASGSTGDGDDDVAFAQGFDIAAWDSATE